KTAIPIPVLADREFDSRSRAGDWTRIEARLADGVLVARAAPRRRAGARRANLGVLVRAVAVQRALRSIPHVAALLDVDEARELPLVEADARVRVAGPRGIWVGVDALRRIL